MIETGQILLCRPAQVEDAAAILRLMLFDEEPHFA